MRTRVGKHLFLPIESAALIDENNHLIRVLGLVHLGSDHVQVAVIIQVCQPQAVALFERGPDYMLCPASLSGILRSLEPGDPVCAFSLGENHIQPAVCVHVSYPDHAILVPPGKSMLDPRAAHRIAGILVPQPADCNVQVAVAVQVTQSEPLPVRAGYDFLSPGIRSILKRDKNPVALLCAESALPPRDDVKIAVTVQVTYLDIVRPGSADQMTSPFPFCGIA